MDSAVFNFQFLGVGGLKVLKKLPLLQWGSKFCLILSRCFLDAGGACQLQQYLFVFQLALRPFLTSFRSYFLKRTTLMDSAFFKSWFLGVGTLKVLKKYSRVAIFVSCDACQLKQYLSSSDLLSNIHDPGYTKFHKNQMLQFSQIFMTPGTRNFTKIKHFIFSNFHGPGYTKFQKIKHCNFLEFS